jgi:hypothetical protein
VVYYFCYVSHASVAEEKAVSLAEQARDPTASLTAFAIRYDYIDSFHNLSDADQGQIVLQPIIPWKWGEQKHIARVTASYVTNAPDWGLLAEDAPMVRHPIMCRQQISKVWRTPPPWIC